MSAAARIRVDHMPGKTAPDLTGLGGHHRTGFALYEGPCASTLRCGVRFMVRKDEVS